MIAWHTVALLLTAFEHAFLPAADFFHSSLSTHFGLVVAFICLVYTATFFLFGVFWWAELA